MLWEHIYNLLKIDHCFVNKYKNIPYSEIIDDVQREKILIINTYYDFMTNEECINFIEKCYNLFQSELHYKLREDYKLVMCILILRSFLDKKIFKNFYENYIVSDDIYNHIFDHFEKYLIYSKEYMPKKSINTLTIHAVDLLVNYSIIKNKIIILKGSTYKSYKYFSIYIPSYSQNINHNYSFLEFKWMEIGDKYYIHTIHYSRIFEVNKKNFNSNKSFKIKNKNYIINKINLKLYVDDLYLSYLKTKLKNKSNILLDLETTYNQLNLAYNKTDWSAETKDKIINFQKKISKLLDEFHVLTFMEIDLKNTPIIFPLYLDFRGRKYYSSRIGPTNSKITRLCYYYGLYKNDEFNIKNNVYSKQYINIINNFCNEHNINPDQKFHECIFWCLIGIGKFYINKNEYPISTDTFINTALNNFNNQNSLDLEKELEIIHYKNILFGLWDSPIKKRVIAKDATASINQIFMKKLGPINQNSLNYVNLGEKNEWYDTYLVYRDKFYEEHQNEIINLPKFNTFFDRKLIKNTIMTIPYSAGFNLCWKNYINNLPNNLIPDKNLKKIYKKFYIFVKEEIQNKFLYIKSSKSLVEKINEEFELLRRYVLESETGEADISYYKLKKSSIDKKYVLNGQNKRVTRLVLEITDALDTENFNISSGANSAHFYDADELRTIEIILGYSIITIHDSYLIDFNNCTKLINAKILHYQHTINKFGNKYKIKNIYILL